MDDKEKNPNLRVVVDNSVPSLADHMAENHRKFEMLTLLKQFEQKVRNGEVESLVLIAKAADGVSFGLAPSDYKRFEMLGILHAAVHIETNKLAVQRPIEESPKDPGA